MKTIIKLFKQVLLGAMFFCSVMPSNAQKKHALASTEHKDFNYLLTEATLDFTFPAGFKEIAAVNNEYFSYDYAMELPDKDFEAWLQVKSQKQNWKSYVQAQQDKKIELANPDSMYLDMGEANAIALTGDRNFLVRNIPPDVLARYNADAGKSYLLDLLDLPVTKHYKYALLISLQKNHTGTLVSVYFTNQKDPEFYKNVSRVGHSLKFKPQAAN